VDKTAVNGKDKKEKKSKTQKFKKKTEVLEDEPPRQLK